MNRKVITFNSHTSPELKICMFDHKTNSFIYFIERVDYRKRIQTTRLVVG